MIQPWRESLSEYGARRAAHRRAERHRRIVAVLREILGIVLLGAVMAFLWWWVVTAA